MQLRCLVLNRIPLSASCDEYQPHAILSTGIKHLHHYGEFLITKGDAHFLLILQVLISLNFTRIVAGTLLSHLRLKPVAPINIGELSSTVFFARHYKYTAVKGNAFVLWM
jgi:hypothetical protein